MTHVVVGIISKLNGFWIEKKTFQRA